MAKCFATLHEAIEKMKKEKLNFGIIGLGNIGQRHLKLLLQNNSIEVKSFCDTAFNKNQNIDGIDFFTDYQSLLANKQIDVIDICTPHHLHADMSIEALKAGKHVLVEKPMCLTTADAKKMIAASKKYKRELIVVKQNRYNQPVKWVDELLHKNKLGKIVEVHCHVLWNRNDAYYKDSDWRGRCKTEAGALFTQGSHFLDLLVHWFGEVTKATTWSKAIHHKIEIDDSGNSTVLFKNGTYGKIIWSNNVYQKNYEGSITIFGEKGTVKIGGQYLNKIEYWDVKNIPMPQQEPIEVLPNLYKAGYQGSSSNHHKVFEDVVAFLLHHKKNNLVHGDEAIKTISSIEKIYKNSEQF